MGVFDLFRKKSTPPPRADDAAPVDKKLASAAKTATDKRAQAYDREQAIRQLCAIGTPEAAAALLKRFTFTIDPSITDQEERAIAFDGIVDVGRGGPNGGSLSDEEREAQRAAVVSVVREFCKRAESLNSPLRVLRELLDDAAYEAELLGMLSSFDTEYTRNVEPKVNLITALEELKSDAVREAVGVYLDDSNETVRFHAVDTIFKQASTTSLAALVELAVREESVRIKNKIAEGFMRLGWVVPEPLRRAFAAALGDSRDFRLGADGKVVRSPRSPFE
ncbi:MAG: HEAT repeat domain-containing protein [Polyangiaceae bacterium]|nr:HEAT repeat domain-containing protein [Polyangiaceae bacterium]